jgi:SAM-dependent methyltransferase
MSEELIWHDENHLQIGETRFVLTLDQGTAEVTESSPTQFLLMKSQLLVQTTLERLPERVDNMVELGIFKGGGIALYEELFSPKCLIGIDRLPDRVGALDEYVQRRSATDRLKLHYGIDQGDREAMLSIARENFGGRCLDLVVDDCSHLYEPTRTSFNVFFPLLRPGGVYLIEDWGWAHWLSETEQYNQTFADEETPLAKLILEAVMLSATNPYIIRHIFIDRSRAFITRARQELPESFNISDAYSSGVWAMEFSKAAGATPTRPDDSCRHRWAKRASRWSGTSR